MEPEEISESMKKLGIPRDLEGFINECSHNSEIENVQERASDSDDFTVNSARSESQNINKKERNQQEAITSTTNDLPRYSANVNATSQSPPDLDSLNLKDPMELLKALLDETYDTAKIIAKAGPENVFKLLFEPNPMEHDNETEITESDVFELCDTIAPLLKSFPIQSRSQTCKCCEAKGAPSDSNPTLSTGPETPGTKSENLNRIHEILRQILAPTSMFTISPQNEPRKPTPEPH